MFFSVNHPHSSLLDCSWLLSLNLCFKLAQTNGRLRVHALDGSCPVTLSVKKCIENVFYVVGRCNKFVTRLIGVLWVSSFLTEFAFFVVVVVGDEWALPHTHPDPLCTHPPTHLVFTQTCTCPWRELRTLEKDLSSFRQDRVSAHAAVAVI